MHEISGLELVICSDYLTDVSLGKALYLRKESDNAKTKKDLVDSYRNRPRSLDHLSLARYFYEVFINNKFYEDTTTGRQKHRILIPKGLNCMARYPVDYDYAKGMLVMHKPWSKRDPLTKLLSDEKLTICTFLEMMEKRQLPYAVLSEYHRAVVHAQRGRYECVAKKAKPIDDVNLDHLTDEELHNHIYWEHSNHLSAQNCLNLNSTVGEVRVNLGIDHDWSKKCFHGERATDRLSPESYTRYLKDFFYGDKDSDSEKVLRIPKKSNGDVYRIEALNEEQKIVVICALEAVVKFLTNDETYKPLRATVVGCGGTGKSYIINTLISVMRNYTQIDDTVKVAAPSGGAAYNVGGCTLHRCLNLSVDPEKLAKDLTAEKQEELSVQLRNLLMLIIDERSMISSALLAAAERNVRHCAFGRQNRDELWGGIPAVLIFGDDYQLLPVLAEGAIQGYAKRQRLWESKPSRKSAHQQLQIDHGHELFINDLTQDVFHLTQNYRTRADPQYAKMLERLRVGRSEDADGQRFMRQFWHWQRDPEWTKAIENDPKTIYLYAFNYEKNRKNLERLAELSEQTGFPVARLQCQWQSNKQGWSSVYRSHFATAKMVLQTDLCIGASVAISGINIVPEAGLYNGARGTIVDYVFDTVCGPNDKQGDHLPRCVIVDFPGLKLGNAKPWDELNPTVSFIQHSLERYRLLN